MRKRIALASLALAMVAAIGLFTANAAWADVSGKCRIIRNDGSVVTGEVTEEGDVYVVNAGKGITIRIAKSEVRAVQKVDAEDKPKTDAAKKAKSEETVDKEGDLSDDEVKKLLGGDELGPDVDPEQDVMPKLDTNVESVEEMKRIAGTTNAPLETDHFVLVYTSSRELALKLASRLEAIYRWNFKFIKLMGITPKRPKFRLEIYFFGDHKEFQAYQSNDGDISPNTLGYFRYDRNRSVFFDMDTFPRAVYYKELLKHANPRDRRKYLNIIKRWKDFQNLEVIQHEASHHCHFNMGVFIPDGRPPRWLSEGLAQMFELPPTSAGAGLAAVNNHRLFQFKEQFGNYPKFPLPLRTFIIDDRMWFNGGFFPYPLGWAMTNYLYRKFPDKFKEYMRIMANREEGADVDMTTRQKEFEDLFGEVNDKWIETFFNFYKAQNVRISELPPEL